MKEKSIKYHVIGGGISGLACAWLLKDKNIDTIVYEAKSRLGGRAYSYDDTKLNKRLDNAVHAIIGANKFMSSFVNKDEWTYTKYFVDSDNYTLDTSLIKNKSILYKAFCNMASDKIDRRIKRKIAGLLFPYTKSQRKVWFSKQDISQRIINVLASRSDKIKLNSPLKSLKTQGNKVIGLDFGEYEVNLGENDKVILALDNDACAKFVKINTIGHSPIINISYFTSQTIFLPKGASFIAQKNKLADFVFVNDGIITAVISDYQLSEINVDELAVKIWKEIDAIRGVDSAFMPEYKVSYNPKATIKHDTISNLLRPKNAKTEYSNVFIAGDWTMQNYPCCMEVAVKSAQRAVKTALKQK